MAVQGSSDVLVDELYLTTHRLRQHVEARLRAKGASVARLRALRMLAFAEEPLRMRDLSDMMGVAARTTTSIVDSLERDGLVERLRHPTDGRAFLLRLTPAGRTRHVEAEEIDREALAQAMSGLAAAERKQLAELLSRIRQSVD